MVTLYNFSSVWKTAKLDSERCLKTLLSQKISMAFYLLLLMSDFAVHAQFWQVFYSIKSIRNKSKKVNKKGWEREWGVNELEAWERVKFLCVPVCVFVCVYVCVCVCVCVWERERGLSLCVCECFFSSGLFLSFILTCVKIIFTFSSKLY